jgi:hypothetical protein
MVGRLTQHRSVDEMAGPPLLVSKTRNRDLLKMNVKSDVPHVAGPGSTCPRCQRRVTPIRGDLQATDAFSLHLGKLACVVEELQD